MAALLSLLVLSQLSTGGPVSITPPAGVAPVRWPDVAFSSTDDVFLAVSGADDIQGQYFSATGAALGAAFKVNAADVFGQAPRVTWSAAHNAFLVTWHETLGNDTRIRGRIIRYNQPALTADFDISDFGTNWEMGATVAYSETSDEFLIGWQDRAGTHIKVQRVSGTGSLIGTSLTIETVPYARDPSIAWDRDTNRFLVVYGGCVGNDDCFIHGQRIEGGTGMLVGTPILLEPSVRAGYVPELAYNAITHQFLVVWFRLAPSGNGLYAKTVDANGLDGPLLTVSAVASYDANDVAWNPISNSFVVVTHGSTAQDLAIELSASGQVLGTGVGFGVPTSNGNFNPRIASSTSGADWLGVTSTEFGRLTAERITTLTRAQPPDAGISEPDAGIDAGPTDPPDAGSQIDGGFTTSPPLPDAGMTTDGGTNISGTGSCGCTTVSSPFFYALLFAALFVTRQRAAPRR